MKTKSAMKIQIVSAGKKLRKAFATVGDLEHADLVERMIWDVEDPAYWKSI